MKNDADLATLNGVLHAYERMLTFLVAVLPEHEYGVFKQIMFRDDTFLDEETPGQLIQNSETRRVAQRILPHAERLRRAFGGK